MAGQFDEHCHKEVDFDFHSDFDNYSILRVLCNRETVWEARHSFDKSLFEQKVL